MTGDAAPPARGAVSPRAYAVLAVGLSLLITVVIGGFNLLVDPYDWFGLDLAWLNGKKNVAYQMDRIFKLRDVTRVVPGVSVIGTSRLGMGMHHDHPALGPDAYNLGLTGAEIYECRRNLQHLHAIRPQRRVVLGLDFIQFEHQAPPAPAFKEERLRVGADGRLQPESYWADVPAILWSVDAIGHSAETIAATRDPDQRALFYDRGTFDEEAMRRWIREAVPKPLRSVQRNGYLCAQLKLIDDYLKKYRTFHYRPGGGRGSKLAEFAAILALARREGIDLHVFITPVHARLVHIYAATGHWEAFRAWKRDLRAAVLAEAAAAGAAPFPLWDFATFAGVTAELPPDPTLDGAEMRWYWEASHFRRTLGALVLDRMFGTDAAGVAVPPDFGVRLDEVDIDAHLEAVDRHHAAWMERDPKGVAFVGIFYDFIRHNLEGRPLSPENQARAEQMRAWQQQN